MERVRDWASNWMQVYDFLLTIACLVKDNDIVAGERRVFTWDFMGGYIELSLYQQGAAGVEHPHWTGLTIQFRGATIMSFIGPFYELCVCGWSGFDLFLELLARDLPKELVPDAEYLANARAAAVKKLRNDAANGFTQSQIVAKLTADFANTTPMMTSYDSFPVFTVGQSSIRICTHSVYVRHDADEIRIDIDPFRSTFADFCSLLRAKKITI